MTDTTPSPASGTTSIELVLDGVADDAVRAEWTALAAAGLSSLAPHTAPSNRPHVTLLERSTPLPDPFPLDGGELAELLPLPLVLGPPILMGDGDRRVLARSVAPTTALLSLHRAVLAAAGPGEDPPHLRPGHWTPHVTLGRRLRLVDAPAALELLGTAIEARGVAVRRWEAATATVTVLLGG
ncbi:hypothetical protein C8046_03700 [Serinibacter arcticus]|uniref:2'-5' RNA ligase n=1 Tax=Serinibacter arcticus TaxID=1655435 RepID=A0A2U1ZSF8_9MICO|nr:2'-5' RNA ligase family protein [Serinibacter arcticus]PWD49918.1 hypothetical protein C8046_03700 [Serinibacter arcticus]